MIEENVPAFTASQLHRGFLLCIRAQLSQHEEKLEIKPVLYQGTTTVVPKEA